jgi:hypothetical protein
MEEELENIRAAITAIPGFPLNKRETFAALIMMGLASRLQPLHITNNKESQQHQANLVSLGFKLADMAVAESDKEIPEPKDKA